MVAGVFAFIGVVIGVVALATNYWTWNSFPPGTRFILANGTFVTDGNDQQTWNVSHGS